MGNDSGGTGPNGRRKKRGWRKGWYHSVWPWLKTCPPGSFRFIQSGQGKDKK